MESSTSRHQAFTLHVSLNSNAGMYVSQRWIIKTYSSKVCIEGLHVQQIKEASYIPHLNDSVHKGEPFGS